MCFGWFKRRKQRKLEEAAAKADANAVVICNPANGVIKATADVKDETFSQDMMGKGFAIIPSDGNITAPCDGTISLVANTGHAFSIKHSSGLEILVHIGIDTVTLNQHRKEGEPLVGFKINKKVGDVVKQGDLVITADLATIKSKGLDIITPVIVVNGEAAANKQILHLVTSGEQKVGTQILKIS